MIDARCRKQEIVITDNETALTENVDYKETKPSNPRQNGQTL